MATPPSLSSLTSWNPWHSLHGSKWVTSQSSSTAQSLIPGDQLVQATRWCDIALPPLFNTSLLLSGVSIGCQGHWGWICRSGLFSWSLWREAILYKESNLGTLFLDQTHLSFPSRNPACLLHFFPNVLLVDTVIVFSLYSSPHTSINQFVRI